MKLVDNPEVVAKRHTQVKPQRRNELAGFLQHVDPFQHAKVLKTFRENGMPPEELALCEDLLGVQSKEQRAKSEEPEAQSKSPSSRAPRTASRSSLSTTKPTNSKTKES